MRIIRVITAGLEALALLFPTATPAGARDWTIDPSGSEIRFYFSSNGQSAQGVFTDITGEGSFDPDHPDEARLALTVAIDSVDLGSVLESLFVKGEDWFDAERYPEASFVLKKLTSIVPGGGAYKTIGDVTIKGVSREISVLVTLETTSELARATGLVVLNRRDFNVGVGLSDRLVTIGEDISLRFDLTATAAK